MSTLSVLAVKAATPSPSGGPKKYFDGDGLYLLVTKSGAKQWRYRFKQEGRERHMGLGSYPAISLAQARELHREARTLVKKGDDPIEARQDGREERAAEREREQQTFKLVASDWLETNRSKWTPGVFSRVEAQLTRWVYPVFGDSPIGDITTPMIAKVLDRIVEDDKTYTAHKLRTYIKRTFNRAIVREIGGVTSNPVDPIDGDTLEAAPKTKNRAAILETIRLGEVLRLIDGYNAASPQVAAVMKLAPLLFVRPGELRKMRWSELDTERSEWVFHSTKKGKVHTVPLSRQVLDILAVLRESTGAHEYCFPNPKANHKPNRPTISENAQLDGLRRLGVTAEEMSPHGWRATARTLIVEELGERADIMRHQLSHTVLDPNGTAYDRTTFIVERHRIMQRWADYLDALRAGGNVIAADFRKGKTAE